MPSIPDSKGGQARRPRFPQGKNLKGVGKPKYCASSKCQGDPRGRGAAAVVFPKLFALWLLCTYTESKTVSVCSEKIKPKAQSNFLLVESCAWFVSIKPGFCGTTWPIYRAGSSKRAEPTFSTRSLLGQPLN